MNLLKTLATRVTARLAAIELRSPVRVLDPRAQLEARIEAESRKKVSLVKLIADLNREMNGCDTAINALKTDLQLMDAEAAKQRVTPVKATA